MGNKVVKKVATFLNDSCHMEMQVMFGSDRRDGGNFAIIDSTLQFVDKIKSRMPKRLVKYVIGELFEDYSSPSELNIYLTLLTGKSIQQGDTSKKQRTLREFVVQTRLLYKIFLLVIWHQFNSQKNKGLVKELEGGDFFEKHIIQKLESQAKAIDQGLSERERSVNRDSDLLKELLEIVIGNISESLGSGGKEGSLKSMTALCSAIEKYLQRRLDRNDSEDSMLELTVQQQITKFFRLLVETFLMENERKVKQRLFDAAVRLSNTRHKLRDQLSLVHAVVTSAHQHHLDLDNLSINTINEPFKKLKTKLVSEFKLKEDFMKAAFPADKMDNLKDFLKSTRTRLYLCNEFGIIMNSKSATYCKLDHASNQLDFVNLVKLEKSLFNIEETVMLEANFENCQFTIDIGDKTLLGEFVRKRSALNIFDPTKALAYDSVIVAKSENEFLNEDGSLTEVIKAQISQLKPHSTQSVASIKDAKQSKNWRLAMGMSNGIGTPKKSVAVLVCDDWEDGSIMVMQSETGSTVIKTRDGKVSPKWFNAGKDAVLDSLKIGEDSMILYDTEGNYAVIDLSAGVLEEFGSLGSTRILGYDFMKKLLICWQDGSNDKQEAKQIDIQLRRIQPFLTDNLGKSRGELSQDNAGKSRAFYMQTLGFKSKTRTNHNQIEEIDPKLGSIVGKLGECLYETFSQELSTVDSDLVEKAMLLKTDFSIDNENLQVMISLLIHFENKRVLTSSEKTFVIGLTRALTKHLGVLEYLINHSPSLKAETDYELVEKDTLLKIFQRSLGSDALSHPHYLEDCLTADNHILSLLEATEKQEVLTQYLSSEGACFMKKIERYSAWLLSDTRLIEPDCLKKLFDSCLKFDQISKTENTLAFDLLLKILKDSIQLIILEEIKKLQDFIGENSTGNFKDIFYTKFTVKANCQQIIKYMFNVLNFEELPQSQLKGIEGLAWDITTSIKPQFDQLITTLHANFTDRTKGVDSGNATELKMVKEVILGSVTACLLTEICKYFTLKEYTAENPGKLMECYTSLGNSLVKFINSVSRMAGNLENSRTIDGFKKVRKIKIEQSSDQETKSIKVIRLNPFKEYIFLLESDQEDFTGRVSVMKAYHWNTPIAAKHEYMANFFPFDSLSAIDNKRLALVSGTWNIGLSLINHKPSLDKKQVKNVKIVMYSRDVEETDNCRSFVQMHLNLNHLPKLVIVPPFLGDQLSKPPNTVFENSSNDKADYLRSLELSKEPTSVQQSEFLKSSLTIDAHRKQLQNYFSEVSQIISQYEFALDLISADNPLPESFAFARRLLNISCNSVRLLNIRQKLFLQLLGNPTSGWPIISGLKNLQFDKDFFEAVCKSLNAEVDLIKGQKAVAVAFFEIIWKLIEYLKVNELIGKEENWSTDFLKLKVMLQEFANDQKSNGANEGEAFPKFRLTATAQLDLTEPYSINQSFSIHEDDLSNSVSLVDDVKDNYLSRDSSHNGSSDYETHRDDSDKSSNAASYRESSEEEDNGSEDEASDLEGQEQEEDNEDDDKDNSSNSVSKKHKKIDQQKVSEEKKEDVPRDVSIATGNWIIPKLQSTENLDVPNVFSPVSPLSLRTNQKIVVDSSTGNQLITLEMIPKDTHDEPKLVELDKKTQKESALKTLLADSWKKTLETDLFLLAPSKMPLLPTLASLALRWLYETEPNPAEIVHLKGDNYMRPFVKLCKSAGAAIAAIHHNIVENAVKYLNRIECPKPLWFDPFNQQVLVSLQSGSLTLVTDSEITQPREIVVQQQPSSAWLGDRILECLNKREASQSKSILDSVMAAWKPSQQQGHHHGLLIDSSAELWLKLRLSQANHVDSQTIKQEDKVESKFDKLKKKLKVGQQDPKRGISHEPSLQNFSAGVCVNPVPLVVPTLPWPVKDIEHELLQRLIEEFLTLNLDLIQGLSDQLVSDLAVSVFIRFSFLEFYSKQTQEPCVFYKEILLDKITAESTLNLLNGFPSKLSTESSITLYGVFNLIKRLMNRAISDRLTHKQEILREALHMVVDSICHFSRKNLEFQPFLRSILLDCYEMTHLVVDALDDTCAGLLDKKATDLEVLISTIGPGYFFGFLNSVESTSDYFDGIIYLFVKKNLLTQAAIKAMKDPNAKYIIPAYSGYKTIAEQAKLQTPEELLDVVARGILIGQVNNSDNTKVVEQHTSYRAPPHVPLRVTLPDSYQDYAIRAVKYEQEISEQDQEIVPFQLIDESRPKARIHLTQDYTPFYQFDLKLPETMPRKLDIEDWPKTDALIQSRDLTFVHPPTSQGHFILTENEGTYKLDRKKIEQFNQFYDADSELNHMNQHKEVFESIFASGRILSNNNLQDENPVKVFNFSDDGVFFYSEDTRCFLLCAPFSPGLQPYLKVFAESDKVCYQMNPFICSDPKKIVRVGNLQYYILFENQLMLSVDFTTHFENSEKCWESGFKKVYEEKAIHKLMKNHWNSPAAYNEMNSWKESVEGSRTIFSFTGKNLIDFCCTNKAILLIFDDPQNEEEYLVEIFNSDSEDKGERSYLRKHGIKSITGVAESSDLSYFLVLHSDGKLSIINSSSSKKKKVNETPTILEGWNVTSIAIWGSAVCLLVQDTTDHESGIELKMLDITFGQERRLKISLDDHDLSKLFVFNQTSLIHDSPTAMATQCTLNSECIFDHRFTELFDFPIAFWLNPETNKLNFKNFAGEPEFYQLFLNLDVGKDNMAFLMTSPFTMKMEGEDDSNLVGKIESFLNLYVKSEDFLEESNESETFKEDHILLNWENVLIKASEPQDFFSPSASKSVIRFTGRIKKLYKKVLEQIKLSWTLESAVTFEVLPNLVHLKNEDWEKYKKLNESQWKPLIDSITPQQWMEIKNKLVEATWNIDFDSNPYPAKVYSDTHDIQEIPQELIQLTDKIPYFKANPEFKLEHLLGAHCAVALMDFWTQCFTISSRFIRRKPVSNHLDLAIKNVFGPTICEMRFQFDYCESVGNFDFQIDRYRAEKSTEEDQNMSLLNQLYYQLMDKAYWNSITLKKVEGIELQFVGEDGLDAGGLLKEFFSKLAEEVTKTLKLFIPSPNYGEALEENDKYIPNPEFLTSIHQTNFLKFGVILGYVYKLFASIPVDFPQCFWAFLLGMLKSKQVSISPGIASRTLISSDISSSKP